MVVLDENGLFSFYFFKKDVKYIKWAPIIYLSFKKNVKYIENVKKSFVSGRQLLFFYLQKTSSILSVRELFFNSLKNVKYVKMGEYNHAAGGLPIIFYSIKNSTHVIEALGHAMSVRDRHLMISAQATQSL